MATDPHRKLVKHYHQPGDFHELTFSCYRQMKLLTNDAWRKYLARSIDAAAEELGFQLTAFVFMPEHVHLLVLPTRPETTAEDISSFLIKLKVPCSQQIKADLERNGSRLLSLLTIRDRPGHSAFRYWQEGPGYDRNLNNEQSVLAAINYIHMNPVRRNLVDHPRKWKWSSARWYLSDRQEIDLDLPRIHSPPPELFEQRF